MCLHIERSSSVIMLVTLKDIVDALFALFMLTALVLMDTLISSFIVAAADSTYVCDAAHAQPSRLTAGLNLNLDSNLNLNPNENPNELV
jgi:hypothetical protein